MGSRDQGIIPMWLSHVFTSPRTLIYDLGTHALILLRISTMMGNQDAFKPIYTQILVCIVLITGGAITLATSPPPDPVCISDCEPKSF